MSPAIPMMPISLEVNGETRERANTCDLILSVRDLNVFAPSFYSLHPGDVLMTGTPQGVGPVRPGDVMRASVCRAATVELRVEAA